MANQCSSVLRLLFVGGALLAREFSHDAAETALPEEGSRHRPNILLVQLDQWRWDWTGFDAPAVQLPSFAALAAKGTRFTHAYVPSPLCAPSRGALAAGLEYDESPVWDNDIDYPVDRQGNRTPPPPTFYSALRAAGYATMLAGKDHLTEKSGVGVDGSVHAKQLGFDTWFRTMDKYEIFSDAHEPTEQYGAFLATRPWPPRQRGGQTPPSNGSAYGAQARCYGYLGGGNCCATHPREGLEGGFLCPLADAVSEYYTVDSWTEARAEELLKAHWDSTAGEQRQPWFLQIGFPSPHPPFILDPGANASDAAKRKYPPAADDAPELLDPAIVLTSRREYGALVEGLDALIGRFLRFVGNEQPEELANMVVIVTSDHGDLLGDHGHYGKKVPWDGAVRVPLVVAGPGVDKGHVVEDPVATVDLAATILEAAGAPLPSGMTSRSLWSLLSGATSSLPRRAVLSGINVTRNGKFWDWRMVVKRFNASCVLKLVCCPRGCPEMGSLLPRGIAPQVGLIRVGPAGDIADVLASGRGVSEARELWSELPAAYRAQCSGVIDEPVPQAHNFGDTDLLV
eukprot:gnl/TRDRNA2_/TRDRNA2_33406_c0_seq1.p1 gnl/TRDRNA2_/TRDRNA2_33406_c0~~gnl/TRDRNA2_/TRDRNA2_33406_c0_seq1.p1  ORF type:complete len:569 (-),score=65.92 gnl/TRDRNA2_/TRDRNA2_33406_c0_seq1:27-1733(-)